LHPHTPPLEEGIPGESTFDRNTTSPLVKACSRPRIQARCLAEEGSTEENEENGNTSAKWENALYDGPPSPSRTWIRRRRARRPVVLQIAEVLQRMKYRDVVKLLETDGWHLDRVVGSHMQFRHLNKPGTVTVPAGGKLAKDVPPGTLSSIYKQAGLK